MESSRRAALQGPFWRRPLNHDMAESLIGQCTMEEIRRATFSLPRHKSPGPDGLHLRFYQHCWDVVGPSVITLVQGFFNIATLPDGVNHTILALIPKGPGPETIGQYQPISLCNSIYKDNLKDHGGTSPFLERPHHTIPMQLHPE
ncbi:hypothetical protein CRG98_016063 [Punica granatum]|uniref:Reverse transcriptase domain-containing protein n=1 Tax=Punica granatum TaxID=22663 RepID=A0A2I0K4T4_PUNGR|nr:hypothetical protein CRG98_016063 [Punica granatum]